MSLGRPTLLEAMTTKVHTSIAYNAAAVAWSVRARLRKVTEPGRFEAHRTFEQKKHDGALAPEVVARFQDRQSEKVGTSRERRSKLEVTDEVRAKPFDQLQMQQKGALLLDRILQERPAIRSVINIGARVDVASSYAAKRHPAVRFISVDFQRDLAEHNAELPQSDNWTFKSGYALDLFRDGLTADAVFMTSTACLFTSMEFDLYAQAFAEAKVKTVIINEPWWNEIGRPWLRKPETVPVDDPYCSGRDGHYHYNYAGKLARGGFRLTSSDLYRGPYFGSYCLQIVADQT